MKLATYRDGSRDGQLVVVSRDLRTAHFANGIATRLQQVLDDWNFLSPQLQDLSVTLNQGRARHAFAFEPRQCMAPLPRAFGCMVAAPAAADAAPVLVSAAGTGLRGPCQDAWLGAAAWGLAAAPALAVVTGDIGMGADAAQGLDGVRLLLLANVWQLPALAAAEAARGAPPLHGLPVAAFGPVAVTPDELGAAWSAGRLSLPLQALLNGRRLAPVEAAPAMPHGFGALLSHLAMTRDLHAGQIVVGGALLTVPGLGWGDRVGIDMDGLDGASVFGAIEQRVSGPDDSAAGTADDAAADAGGPPTDAA
jgi:fumarylacetoacetate (FAA) hydrolase